MGVVEKGQIYSRCLSWETHPPQALDVRAPGSQAFGLELKLIPLVQSLACQLRILGLLSLCSYMSQLWKEGRKEGWNKGRKREVKKEGRLKKEERKED